MRYKGKSVSMERKEPSSMEELMPQLLRVMRLSSGMNDNIIMSAWDKVTGAATYTLSKYVKNGVLYCTISSSVVRNQLFFNKDAIVEAINREVLADSLYLATPGRKPVKTLILK